MRPEFENGHLRVPPLPPAWINAEVDFMPGESSKEEGEGLPDDGKPRRHVHRGFLVGHDRPPETFQPLNGG